MTLDCGECMNCVQSLIDNDHLGLGVYLPCERLCSDLPAHLLFDDPVPHVERQPTASASSSTSTPTRASDTQHSSLPCSPDQVGRTLTRTASTSPPADFPGLSLSPPLSPLEMRNIPSPPSLASDSADEAGLPALSQIMSQMRHSSSPVRRFSVGQDSDGGSGSDSDMYVDEGLTQSVTQEEPEDRFLGAPAHSSRDRTTGFDPRRDQHQPRMDISAVKQEPDEDAEGLRAPMRSEERRQDANDDVGDEDDDDASYIPADSDANVEKSPPFYPSTGKDLDMDEEREEDELELAGGVDRDRDGDEGAHGQGTHTIPSPAPPSKTATTRKRKNPFDDMDTGGSTKEEKLNCLKFKKAKRTPVLKSVSGSAAENKSELGSSGKRKVPVEEKEKEKVGDADAMDSTKGDKLKSLKFKKHKPTTSTPDRAPKSDPRPKPTPVPKPTSTSRTVLRPTSAARPDPAPKPLPNSTPSSNTGDCSSSKVVSRPPISVPSTAKERSAPTSSNAKASVKAHKYTKHPTLRAYTAFFRAVSAFL